MKCLNCGAKFNDNRGLAEHILKGGETQSEGAIEWANKVINGLPIKKAHTLVYKGV